MEDTQTKAALGSRPRRQLDALATFALTVKPDVKPKRLAELLDELPDFELKQLQRYASVILKTASPFSGSYYQQAKRMYPAIGETKHLLLAAVLQEIEPRENTDGPHEERAKITKQQKDQTDELLAKYKPSPISEAGLPYIIREDRLVRNRDSNDLDFRTEEQKEAALADRVISSVIEKLGYTGEQKPSGSPNIDLPGKLVVDDQGQFASKRDFVTALKPIAEDMGEELGIDPRIVMAQAILEPGYGSNVKGNNYFGIKSHGKADGQTFTTHEAVDGLMVKQQDQFRKYDSLEDSVRDYALFLTENKRYRPLLEAKTLDDQIDALAGSGYATDNKYAAKIRGIVKGKTFMELLE